MDGSDPIASGVEFEVNLGGPIDVVPAVIEVNPFLEDLGDDDDSDDDEPSIDLLLDSDA